MEALIATRDAGQYFDGDIIEAFSLNRILLANAEALTSTAFYPLHEVTGLRANGTALESVTAAIHRYKFTRTSETTVDRLDQVNQQVTALDYQFINVPEFINRRLEYDDHRFFGLPGNEVWYGKRLTNVDSSTVWDALEANSDHRREEHSQWHLTELEKSRFLPINLTGKKQTDAGVIDVVLSDPTVWEYKAPHVRNDGVDEEGEPIETVLSARRWKVPYWDLAETLDINVGLVRAETRVLDARAIEDIPHIDAAVIDKGQ